MMRVARRPVLSVLTTCWRSHTPVTGTVKWPHAQQPLSMRPISTGIFDEKKNLTFTPKEVSPALGSGQPVQGLDAADQTAVTEIDLTQFLASDLSSSAAAVAEVVEKIGPLTATDIGLTWWCPTGGMFKLFGFLHELFPWWGTIAVATLIARVLVSPLVVYSQRNAAKMSQTMPELQAAQQAFAKARRIGNQSDIMKASMELQQAMLKTNHSMTASLIPMLVQTPIFVSFFLTLRAMTSYPVEDMATQGLLWFKDLTLADPYYALPVMTASTLFVVLRLGVEFGNGATPPGMGPKLAGIEVKNIITYVMPLFVLFFTRNFASGILVYWCTTNVASLAQVMILQQPRIRKWLAIPEVRKLDPADKTAKQKRSLTESWEEFKLSNQVEDRSRILSEQAFAQAATGPLRKTYKTDPTKQKDF